MKKAVHIFLLTVGIILPAYIMIYLCNSFLLKRDSASYIPLYEIKHRDDIEMVFIGSSIVRNGINPACISEKTGMKSFSLGIPGMKFPGIETCIKFVEEKNHPKYIIVVAEPDVFTAEIPSETNMVERIWPHLDTPIERLLYYFDLCTRNGAWIENALVFQRDMIETMEDFRKVLSISNQLEFYAEEIHQKNPAVQYERDGFLRVLVDDTPAFRLMTEYHPWNGDKFSGIRSDTVRRIQRVKNICDSLNAEMILMIPPTHTVNILSYPADMSAITEIGNICKENGITFWNFRMTRREYWPDLDPYFYDTGHLSGTGADLFSDALGEFLFSYFSGNDVLNQFYSTWEEYLSDAPMTNAWMDFSFEKSGQLHITAGFNGGTRIIPEYQFSVLDGESEAIICDFQAAKEISVNYSEVAGKKIRVTVRNKNDLDQNPVSYICACP